MPHSPKRIGSPVKLGVLTSPIIPCHAAQNRLVFKATLLWRDKSEVSSALIDSGADANFMDITFARRAGIPKDLLPSPITAFALDGRSLGFGSDLAPPSQPSYRLASRSYPGVE
ncbi:hypothetical protein SKAU_G00099820 [Synaphobranchus kaupii]|uniref:Peptidase A2 domain-containing protein n=1 Tax=Synaphobranchus kaupii TaxID=118154 RepID=A0A9Q1FY05_SYNKA|nr:hypothetical protein SKAU_G00099820 [Synaphobranchus kaupii]